MTAVRGLKDTGERRRIDDVPPSITDLIDEETVQSIVQEAWLALVGEEEYLRTVDRRGARPVPAQGARTAGDRGRRDRGRPR